MIGDDLASPNQSLDDRIKKICVAFEKALQAGERPSIASLLNEFDGAERSAFFRELLLVEIHYRDRQRETPSRTEYLQQFPEFREQIYDTDFPPNEVDPTTSHPIRIGTVGDPDLATKSYDQRSTIAEQWIGRYRLKRILGEGTFGRVYLAYDDDLQRQVAIKVPTANRFERPEDADEYLNEARTAASLDHPNIVPVHDVGRMEDGSIYVVSKLIDGETLMASIRNRRLNFRESAQLIATIAQALHHAHEKRLIHRDVKPANILIDENNGTPYVADFGLAIRDEVYLRDSRIVGTPAYMSPEQARGEGHRLDGRSDIFSLGVVFY